MLNYRSFTYEVPQTKNDKQQKAALAFVKKYIEIYNNSHPNIKISLLSDHLFQIKFIDFLLSDEITFHESCTQHIKINFYSSALCLAKILDAFNIITDLSSDTIRLFNTEDITEVSLECKILQDLGFMVNTTTLVQEEQLGKKVNHVTFTAQSPFIILEE